MRISDWSSDVCSSDLAHASLSLQLDMLRRVHEQILIQSDLAQFVDHDADARAAALPQKVAQQGRLAAPEKAGDDSERDRIMHVAGLPGSHRSADRSGVRKDQIGRASCRERVCKYV